MIVEKLRSLLRLGTLSTRYKDIFDIYYLLGYSDREQLLKALSVYVFYDADMRENNIKDICKRIESVFNDAVYLRQLYTHDANWLGEDVNIVLQGILNYFKNI